MLPVALMMAGKSSENENKGYAMNHKGYIQNHKKWPRSLKNRISTGFVAGVM